VATRIESKLNMSLAELKLSVRATNCLGRKINTVRTWWPKRNNCWRRTGETTLTEVRRSWDSACTWNAAAGTL
jgi:hypothetical protein